MMTGKTTWCVVGSAAWLAGTLAAAVTAFRLTASAGWLVAAFSVIWFVTFGIGTTRQLVREHRDRMKQQPNLPPLSCWTKVTQGFSYGLWSAAGWPAAYALWVLWRDHWRDHPDQISAGLALGLLIFALMSVTGWLPDRLEALLGRKPN
jgi:hypothetical protein